MLDRLIAHTISSGDLAGEDIIKFVDLFDDLPGRVLGDNVFGIETFTMEADEAEEADEDPFSAMRPADYLAGGPSSAYRRHSLFGVPMEREVGSAIGPAAFQFPSALELARLEADAALQTTVQKLVERVQNVERLLEDTNRMMLVMSQSYYWTPGWQAREERADADAELGRSKQYNSVEEIIADLNK